MIDFDDIKIQREYEHRNTVFGNHRALKSQEDCDPDSWVGVLNLSLRSQCGTVVIITRNYLVALGFSSS